MELKDAFKLEDLAAEFKKQGLPVLEQNAEVAASILLQFVKDGLTKMGGMYAVIGLPGVAMLEPVLKEQIDAIDGEPG